MNTASACYSPIHVRCRTVQDLIRIGALFLALFSLALLMGSQVQYSGGERGTASLCLTSPTVRGALLRSFQLRAHQHRNLGAQDTGHRTQDTRVQEHRSTGAQVSERLKTEEDGRINDYGKDSGPTAPDHAPSASTSFTAVQDESAFQCINPR